MTTIQSDQSVEVTTQNILKALKKNKFLIMKKINHQQKAKSGNVNIEPINTILFGKPSLGSPFIAANKQSALLVTMSIVIYQERGATYVSYWDPISINHTFKFSHKVPDQKARQIKGHCSQYDCHQLNRPNKSATLKSLCNEPVTP